MADDDSATTPKTGSNPLCRRVRSMLWRSGYVQLRSVAIKSTREGHIRLEGRVCTYFLKQIAQVAAQRVDGVETLDNVIKVVPIIAE